MTPPIPAWAKIAVATAAAMLIALATFVTRVEYNEVTSQLAEMRRVQLQILWRVGGPLPERTNELTISRSLPCIDEEALPESGLFLDSLWIASKRLANTKLDPRGRPRVCFAQAIVLIVNEDGTQLSRMLGHYDHESHRVLVALAPDELNSMLECTLQHEMLHALVGPDEARVRALVSCPQEAD